MANSSAHMIDTGAVVFTRDATIGLAAITTRPMAVSQHIIAWVCNESLDRRFILRVINAMTQELDRLTFGATIKTIGMGDVKELTTPVPPWEEQQRIVAHLDSELARHKKASDAIQGQVARLREYRQALITAAVTGQIDVSDTPLNEA
jgi:type I restriction enzyme S subunit